MRIKNKTMVRAILVYIVLTIGMQMFLYAYTNSYNRLTDEKITPASLIVGEESAELKILNRTYNFSLDKISPDSRIYFIAYLFSPDELRAELLFFREQPCFP
ncbi:MAG: hypothetical protein NC340_04325 [Ruminococcus flavefaciens]|nr:hypothetical protein [Ruminococcus flavefaciens]MCM1229110.1 hypothetical protein [Ruminococcus flavefaciens]